MTAYIVALVACGPISTLLESTTTISSGTPFEQRLLVLVSKPSMANLTLVRCDVEVLSCVLLCVVKCVQLSFAVKQLLRKEEQTFRWGNGSCFAWHEQFLKTTKFSFLTKLPQMWMWYDGSSCFVCVAVRLSTWSCFELHRRQTV